MRTVHAIRQTRHAAAILAHPLRPRILAAARQPVSAAQLARAFNLPRQRINYHVRQLAAAGLLQPAGQQRRRNMVEQQYIASADSYVLSPDVLAEVAPQRNEGETSSAAHLLGLCAHAQMDLALIAESAHQAGLRVRTFGLQSAVYFQDAQQRADFTHALADALNDVVARYSSPVGSAFRLIVGCYPAG